MKKLLLWLVAAFLPLALAAQTMTDDQVMQMIIREHNQGTSQAQIVTKLMQSGVDISQIRRVRHNYERLTEGKGLGTVETKNSATSRLRTNNGQKRAGTTGANGNTMSRSDIARQQNNTSYQLQDITSYQTNYDEQSPDFINYSNELSGILPADTATMLKQLTEQVEKNKRKVFGRDIFNNKNLTFEPNMNIATPAGYRLGPGDAVYIDIYGASQKTVEGTVSPDGYVTIEGYGPVQVSGLTVSQANARLRATLGSRYRNSKIRLSVGQTKTIMVNVMGEVQMPGTYTLSAFATVFHALYMAGGTNDLGTLRNIKVYRHNKLVTVVDIYDYILNGKLTGNIKLADNDVIVVGPYDCMVRIDGKVKRPMYYEMKRNESISSLLRYAGGFTGDAYTKAVRVMRKTGRERSVFNVEEFDMSSFRVADGDSVTVDSILPRYENTVEVKGAVFRPGMYQLGQGVNSVRTLVQQAEGLTEQAFTARAVMHRMKPDRALEVVSVNLDGIMNGTSPDIPLRENDVLFVPERTDADVERTITIQGEVRYPGVYRYADNETIEDFVLQAGGLTDKASTVKVDVSRRIVNPKALVGDSVIARTYSLKLKDGFVVDGTPGFVLQPYDEVFVRKSPAYSEQKNVTIDGEVMFAGTYALSMRNARLTDLLKRAGGPTQLAYIKGARLIRRTNEAERERMQTALKMAQEQQQENLLELAASSNNSSLTQMADKDKGTQLEKFQVPATYPVGIELDKALADPNSDANLVLREGDRLVLPQYNSTVKVNGAVLYPNTVAYLQGKKPSYYIDAAGGYTQNARKGSAYIIYMNGMVAKVGHGAKVSPGCEIVVPSKINRHMTAAEKLSMGSSAASIAAVLATIANLVK